MQKNRETLQLIKEAEADVEVVDYLKEPLTEDEIYELLSKLNLPVDYLIRKNEELFKQQFKGKNLTEDEWVKVLAENPKLLERPIVVKDDEAILGRPPENVRKLL